MVRCPSCLYNNLTGAVFCSECGAQLIFDESQKTGSVRITNGLKPTTLPASIPQPAVEPAMQRQTGSSPTDAIVSLYLLESGIYLPLLSEDDVVLGRTTEGQSVTPDINLEPYHAFDAGVSRIHAAIRLIKSQTLITDLGSSNGTRVNGTKIEPHIPYPIKHGDLLNLGKFKIQVIIGGQEVRPSKAK